MKYKLKDNAEEVLATACDDIYEGWNRCEIIEIISCEIVGILTTISSKLNDNDICELINKYPTSCAIVYDGLDKENAKNVIRETSNYPSSIITADNYSIDAIRILIDEAKPVSKYQLTAIEDILVKNMTDELVELLAPYEDGREFLIEHKDLNSTITAAVNTHRLKEI